MEKTENKAYRFAELAILLYFIETTVDGTGRIIDFGFISIQMILFSLAFVASLYPLIKNFKAVMTNPCVIAALLFGIVIVLSAFIGYRRGCSTANIRADITSVMGLALLPGTIATFIDSKMLEKDVNILFWVAAGFSAVVVVLFCLFPIIGKETVESINNLYRSGNASDGVLGHYAYFRVSALMIPMSAVGVLKLKNADNRQKPLLYFAEAAMIMLILLSIERSEFLGLAVALLIVLAVRPKDIGHYLKAGIITLAIIVAFIGLASLTRGEVALLPSIFGKMTSTEVGNSFDYAEFSSRDENSELEIVEENFTDPEVVSSRAKLISIIGSDNLRKIMIQRHEYFIKNNLLFGTGLGFDMNFSDGGKSEYMYLDFIMKLGIIGFVFFVLAYFMPVIQCSQIAEHCPLTTYLMAGYIGIAVVSYFEPYLTNPMGIMVLCLLASSVTIEKERI